MPVDNPQFQRTKIPQLRVKWQMVPNAHGILTIVIRHSKKEIEEYRLQQVPRKYYEQMLRRADPEVLVNQLLTMYLKEESDEYHGEW